MDRGESTPDWFLREWMIQRGKKQADIIRDLGWERGRVSKICNSRQPYGRADVVQLSRWLGIQPFELLMSPGEAIGMRNLRSAAQSIVAEEEPPPFEPPPANTPPPRFRRTG